MALRLEQFQAAADVLLRQNDHDALAVGEALAGWINGGGQRAAWAALAPLVQRGGDLGRGDAIAESETILRKWRRKREDRSDTGWAMDFRRDACRYLYENFLDNQESGSIPEDEYLRDIHRMIDGGAIFVGGKIISDTTIIRRLK
ncbi:hypothetical protein [Paracoccus sp. SY]|uniref:hypothetical protein n=1 Tax=Paracoccus sp. SY TaxID=1330255 RepID=UPI000CD0E9FB|nr:hypothetical protein [Paracoccus sp. SY]